ncbi:hypothetical protein ACQY1Q_06470 [Tenacibaculum sp. TC6]|uniref:hypothetical protein n=1 Tax=Tenacibaculum sp. TC6 TaxID=3423223 RepID=UPI003D364D4D
MNTLKVSLLIVFVFLGACKQHKNTTKDTTDSPPKTTLLKNYMVGNWETTYIKIAYTTFKKADSLYVFEDDFSRSNSGKAQSAYADDGTFTAWFLQPDGKKVGETGGVWNTKGDSLFVDYSYLGKQVQAWYKVTQTNDGFEATVTYDWGDDGEFDDHLFMKSKRIQKP